MKGRGGDDASMEVTMMNYEDPPSQTGLSLPAVAETDTRGPQLGG